jgi:hypothetical protein
MAMLVKARNAECLAERSLEYFRCADDGCIVQVCGNMNNFDEVTNFELTVAGLHHLTRIRRKNPAFNYGFFRPNPLAFERQAGKNAGHGREFACRNGKAQGEIFADTPDGAD